MSLRRIAVIFGFLLVLGSCGTDALGERKDAGVPPTVESCSSGLDAGEACNTLTNVAAPITPTCAPGSLPVGTGGRLVPGTYVLSEQMYYRPAAGCPTQAIASTLFLSGSCIQQVTTFANTTFTSSVTVSVQDNAMTSSVTCLGPGLSLLTADTGTKTFTATPTTITLFTLNSAVGNSNPDRVEVFVKQ